MKPKITMITEILVATDTYEASELQALNRYEVAVLHDAIFRERYQAGELKVYEIDIEQGDEV